MGLTENAELNRKPEYAPIMDWITECLNEVRVARNYSVINIDNYSILGCTHYL